MNIGTMGFIAELEAGELELLRKLPTGDYTLEPRSMIDVTVTGANGQKLLHETALNDAVVTKGAIARGEGDDIPDATKNQAAQLAVYYSSQRGGSKVAVDYTEVRNIKKTSDLKPVKLYGIDKNAAYQNIVLFLCPFCKLKNM